MGPFNRVMRHKQRDPTTLKLGLSAPQAAQALGVSLTTIYRWSDLRYLESYQTPTGQRRFSQERIDRFISLLEHPHVADPQIDRQVG
jgi:excisionase family DNA binding protein